MGATAPPQPAPDPVVGFIHPLEGFQNVEKVHQIAPFIGENLKKISVEGVVPPPQTSPHHTPSPRRLDPHTFGVTACPDPTCKFWRRHCISDIFNSLGDDSDYAYFSKNVNIPFATVLRLSTGGPHFA